MYLRLPEGIGTCLCLLKTMSEHGATLQTFNQELVKCLEDLRLKRDKLQSIIDDEEASKCVLEKNVRALQEKLQVLNNNLNSHTDLRDGYDRTIRDTEIAFKKILDSSQALLHLVQHEASTLENRIDKIKLDG